MLAGFEKGKGNERSIGKMGTQNAKMPVSEIVHQLLAATITVKMMEIADREGGDTPVYLTLRPLLVSSLLYSAYRSIKVGSESEVEA